MLCPSFTIPGQGLFHFFFFFCIKPFGKMDSFLPAFLSLKDSHENQSVLKKAHESPKAMDNAYNAAVHLLLGSCFQ